MTSSSRAYKQERQVQHYKHLRVERAQGKIVRKIYLNWQLLLQFKPNKKDHQVQNKKQLN